jgi:hypothetical protein
MCPLTVEANMEIRNQSKTGPVIPPLAEVTTALGHQIDDLKQAWLERLNRDPASFASIEIEIHNRFHRLADQMTACLLAEATVPDTRAEPEKKGGPAATTDRNGPRRRGD